MKKSARKADERQIKKKLFDSKQKKIYEQEIEPLIVQLKERCRQNIVNGYRFVAKIHRSACKDSQDNNLYIN